MPRFRVTGEGQRFYTLETVIEAEDEYDAREQATTDFFYLGIDDYDEDVFITGVELEPED